MNGCVGQLVSHGGRPQQFELSVGASDYYEVGLLLGLELGFGQGSSLTSLLPSEAQARIQQSII